MISVSFKLNVTVVVAAFGCIPLAITLPLIEVMHGNVIDMQSGDQCTSRWVSEVPCVDKTLLNYG